MSAKPEHFDVAVVGGGSAGIAAAISAAECGARCALIERAETLGGNISQALVHTICGLYLPAEAGDAQLANPGFPGRFARQLERAGAAGRPERAGRVWVLPTDPPRLARVAENLCRQTAGLDVLLGCDTIAAALASGNESQQLRLRERSGREVELSAATLVDATVAALGGADTEMAEPGCLQLPSYCFGLADVDTSELEELRGFGRLRITHALAGAVRSGSLPTGCEAVLLRPGCEAGRIYVTLNLPRPDGEGYRPLDPSCIVELSAQARSSAERIVEFLRRARPAFEKCRVEAWPARIGVRETRRICGREPVVADDVRSGRSRPDEVATSSWPIELWQDHRRAHFDYPVGPCSIPLGALTSRSHPRLAAAGRCLGADREALGALRVIGVALATGEAAGVAAARAADSGSALAEVAPERIRQHILERAQGKP